MTPLVYWDDGLQCLLHVCVCARRQRFIPLISTPSELRGRRFTRRKSAWLLSWSFSGSRTSTSRMRWSQWAGTIYLTFAACVFLRSICLRLLCIKQNRCLFFFLHRQSMSEMQKRHVPRGANPGDSSPHHHLQGVRGKLLQHSLYLFLPNEVFVMSVATFQL